MRALRPGAAGFALAMAACVAGPLAAMGPWQGLPSAELRQFLRDDYGGRTAEAGARVSALARSYPEARDLQAAFLFERQDYAGAETVLTLILADLPPDNRSRSWPAPLLARSQADQGRWAACLETLRTYAGLTPSVSTLFLEAEALDATGATAEARRAFGEALKISGDEPQAALLHFKAAAFYERQGEAEAAEREYKKSQKKDNSYTAVHKLLARLYLSQDRPEDAKTRLERARGVDAEDQESLQALNDLLDEHPELAAKDRAQAAATDQARVALANPQAQPLEGNDRMPVLRIGVLKEAESFRFKIGACGLAVFESDGQGRPGEQKASLDPGEACEVKQKKGGWRLTLGSGKRGRELKFETPLLLQPESLSATTRLYDVAYGAGYFWAGKEDRAYRGRLELLPQGGRGLTVVNLIPLEEYLLGVVAAEMPSYWPREALRAQAIAARTDALRKRGRHQKEGFDLCAGVHCAAYRGFTGEVAATNEAVISTRGEVLEDGGGRLAETLYMNSCGGHTQSSQEAWGNPSDLLAGRPGGVDDLESGGFHPALPLAPDKLLAFLDQAPGAYCRDAKGEPASNFRWVARFSRQELGDYVNRVKPVGDLLDVAPVERGASGFIRTLKLQGVSGTASVGSDFIRGAVKGLKSNLFYVETRRDSQGLPLEFLFHGGGWGHGVGLCQAGAAGRAAAGQKGEEILKAYFPGPG